MKNYLFFLLFTLGIIANSCSQTVDYQEENKVENFLIKKTALAEKAMVVSAHPTATEAGLSILKAGGNAIDAAIAVQFALAVSYPNAGNIGGGGFMVIRKQDGEVATLDYREKAPAAATENNVPG